MCGACIESLRPTVLFSVLDSNCCSDAGQGEPASMCPSVRFAHGVAPAQKAEHNDQQAANFNEDFFAVERVERCVLQIRVGEKAVPEERDRGGVDDEMK